MPRWMADDVHLAVPQIMRVSGFPFMESGWNVSVYLCVSSFRHDTPRRSLALVSMIFSTLPSCVWAVRQPSVEAACSLPRPPENVPTNRSCIMSERTVYCKMTSLVLWKYSAYFGNRCGAQSATSKCLDTVMIARVSCHTIPLNHARSSWVFDVPADAATIQPGQLTRSPPLWSCRATTSST